MAIVTMVLGESGTGKSTSLRNFDPQNTLLIQSLRKPLPFRSPDWKPCVKDEDGNSTGNIFVSDKAATICSALERAKQDIIVIDDSQYIMANEFMRGVTDEAKGNEQFMKFNRIAHNMWSIFNAASQLPDHKRVYFLSHVQTDDHGKTKIKTVGKLLDEKITPEGMVSIVLRTHVINGKYSFSTQNNGNDTVKSPLGMFESESIDNDLNYVDQQICQYYGIN